MLNTLLTMLTADTPAKVTYAQIETAMTNIGLDPYAVQDLYNQVIDSLTEQGVLIVENLALDSVWTDVDEQAEEAADDVVAQLATIVRNPDEFRHPLLSAAQERRLLEIYRDGQRARREAATDLSTIQQRATQRRIDASEQALEELVRCNLRLIANIVLRVAPYAQHMTFDDLIQEGKIGLVRAIQLYDLDLGLRLSTYATWWIRQAIMRAFADQDRAIRIPVHMVETIQRVQRTVSHLDQYLNRPPSAIEIALECPSASGLSEIDRLAVQLRPALLVRESQTEQERGDVMQLSRAAEKIRALLNARRPDHALTQQLQRCQSTLQRTLNRAPTDIEIALDCRLSEILAEDVRVRLQLASAALQQGDICDQVLLERVEAAARRIRQIQGYAATSPMSLDVPVSTDKDSTLGDFIAERRPSVEDEVTARERRVMIEHVIDHLPEREQLVLKLRYGLTLDSAEHAYMETLPGFRTRAVGTVDGEGYTLQEIGTWLDVTRERVRQLEEKALKKLRHPKFGKKLRDYLED